MRLFQASQAAVTIASYPAKTRLESLVCRRNCQTFSTGFSSGDLGGSGSKERLSGRCRLPWHASRAEASTTTACLFAASLAATSPTRSTKFMEWPAPQLQQRRLLPDIRRERLMAVKVAVLGIDLGKNSCSLVGLDAAGAVVKRRRMRPQNIPAFTSSLPTCVVAMEACCGAHHLGRLLALQGHTVRLMSPEYVRPYVKSQKNDDRDGGVLRGAPSRAGAGFAGPHRAPAVARVRSSLRRRRKIMIATPKRSPRPQPAPRCGLSS